VARKVELSYGEMEFAASAMLLSDRRAEVRLAGHDKAFSLDLGQVLRAAHWPGHITLFSATGSYTFAVPDPFERAAEATAGHEAIRAPMPGLVKLVRVGKGESVGKGQQLLVLEAMKMEHAIAAPHDAVVAEIVAEGVQVTDGTVLVRFEAEPGKSEA
jgi:3-methylcrotonyl-CoA carboxylase alpha subunit